VGKIQKMMSLGFKHAMYEPRYERFSQLPAKAYKKAHGRSWAPEFPTKVDYEHRTRMVAMVINIRLPALEVFLPTINSTGPPILATSTIGRRAASDILPRGAKSATCTR